MYNNIITHICKPSQNIMLVFGIAFKIVYLVLSAACNNFNIVLTMYMLVLLCNKITNFNFIIIYSVPNNVTNSPASYTWIASSQIHHMQIQGLHQRLAGCWNTY